MDAKRPPVVVLVEDHRDTIDMYSEFLKFSGFDVVTTDNADEGFDLVLRHGAVIVVTDFWLTGTTTGGDLCRRLKHDDRTHHVPTLLVTASSQRKEVEEFLAFGCSVVRLKPYSPDALARDVRTLIAHEPISAWPIEYVERHPETRSRPPRKH